jgi:hypothetical protein
MSELVPNMHEAVEFIRVDLRPTIRCAKVQKQLNLGTERQDRVVEENVSEKTFLLFGSADDANQQISQTLLDCIEHADDVNYVFSVGECIEIRDVAFSGVIRPTMLASLLIIGWGRGHQNSFIGKYDIMRAATSPLFEIAFVFVRLDYVASFIVNANHSGV